MAEFNNYIQPDKIREIEGRDGQAVPIGQLSLLPNLDALKPVKSYTFNCSGSRWYKLVSRENPADIPPDENRTVICRLTTSYSGSYGEHNQIIDLLWIHKSTSPNASDLYAYDKSWLTGTAAGIYQVREVRPVDTGSGYDWYLEVNPYGTNKREVTVEVFQDFPEFEWFSGSTTSYNSTNYAQTAISPCSNYGITSKKAWSNINVGTATSAAYISGYLPIYPGQTMYRAGEALTGSRIAFVSTDNGAYDIRNTTKEIKPDQVPFQLGDKFSSGSMLSYAYVRDRVATSFTAVGLELTGSTTPFEPGEEIYLRCRLENGKIYSDGFLTSSVAPGYTWINLGYVKSDNGNSIGFNTVGREYFTLDSSGNLTHINGRPIGAGIAESSSYALVAGRLDGTSGSTTVPVWINNGVPTPITSYSGTASFAVSSSISADSDKLGGKAANQYASSSHTHSVSDVTGLSSISSSVASLVGKSGSYESSASLASAASSWITANSSSINSATSSAHTHSNKAVLDGITAANTASWKDTATVVSTSSSIWSGKQDAISDLGTIRTQAASGSSAYTWIKTNSSSINSATASAHTHTNKAYLDSISAVVISGSIDAAIDSLVAISGSVWSAGAESMTESEMDQIWDAS